MTRQIRLMFHTTTVHLSKRSLQRVSFLTSNLETGNIGS